MEEFTIWWQSWLTRVVPGNWKLANAMPSYKGWKEDLYNAGTLWGCQPVEGHGTDHAECHYMAHPKQPGILDLPSQ